MAESRRILVLGSTGSIGRQTLDVITHLNTLHERGACPIRYEVVGLAAGVQGELLSQQCAEHAVPIAAIADDSVTLEAPSVLRGTSAAEQLVRETDADLVVAAMVGSAGLPATMAALELGRDVALANKETLVAAGSLVIPAARRTGASLFPIDSEHAAIWQCLSSSSPLCPPCEAPDSVSRVILTASGGPFRGKAPHEVHDATPEQALRHPTWQMGPKVTIDSATLMNKALEVIEAHWLFSLPSDRIDVVIHPQSIVHSLVEFVDGSLVAQLSAPDMRGPIQSALTHPIRLSCPAPTLDFAKLSELQFTPASEKTHRALALARLAINERGSAGATINAANEAAVRAFLDGRIPFGRIIDLTEQTIEQLGVRTLGSLDDAIREDLAARARVEELIAT